MAIKIANTTVISDSREITNLGAPLAVAQGGTGAGTLTGILVGSGTSAVTTKTNPAGAFVGTTDIQTLTNKTLTSPDINGGTIDSAVIGALTAAAATVTTLTATGNATVSGTLTATGTLTANGALLANGNVTLGNAGTDTVTIVSEVSVNGSVGTSGQVLSSRGADLSPQWTTPFNFPAGTAMLFAQTAAPTGWTKSTTHNNKALRVVNGTAGSGGTVAFTTAFASQSVTGTVGATTLTTAQIPAHSHTYLVANDEIGFAGFVIGSNTGGTALSSSSTGDGGSHTHSFTGTAINLAVQYVDVIIATKD